MTFQTTPNIGQRPSPRQEKKRIVSELICQNEDFMRNHAGSVRDPTNQRFRRTQEKVPPYTEKTVCPRVNLHEFVRLDEENGEDIWTHYQRIKTSDGENHLLGQGAHGSVCQVTHRKTGATRALKVIKKSSNQKDSAQSMIRIQREILLLQRLEHPNIMKTYATLEDNDHIYVVMEMLEGGELFDDLKRKKRIPENEVSTIALQILSALHYAHENNIYHRDIKLEDIVYLEDQTKPNADRTLKVIDWGYACKFAESLRTKPDGSIRLPAQTMVGTPFYIAPEVIDGRYDYRCDLWSLGIVLYCLLTGTPPFFANTPREIMAKVSDPNSSPDYGGEHSKKPERWEGVSDEAKDFVRRLLTRDIDARMTAIQAFDHIYIRRFNPIQNLNKNESRFIYNRFKAFSSMPPVCQLVANMIVFCGFKQSIESCTAVVGGETLSIKNLFTKLDAEHRGCLLPVDLEKQLRESVGPTQYDGKEDCLRMLEKTDLSGNGCVDYLEFLSLMIDVWDERAIIHAFNKLDVDQDGVLGVDDLHHWIATAKLKLVHKRRQNPKPDVPPVRQYAIIIEPLREDTQSDIEKLHSLRKNFNHKFKSNAGLAFQEGFSLEYIIQGLELGREVGDRSYSAKLPRKRVTTNSTNVSDL